MLEVKFKLKVNENMVILALLPLETLSIPSQGISEGKLTDINEESDHLPVEVVLTKNFTLKEFSDI
jgi:hypothetical protein